MLISIIATFMTTRMDDAYVESYRVFAGPHLILRDYQNPLTSWDQPRPINPLEVGNEV